MGLLWLLIVGFIVGLIARSLVPGRHDLGVGGTILLGVVGSFVGGFLGYVLLDSDPGEGAFQPSGFIGSIIGAVIALWIYRSLKRRRRPVL